VKQEKERKLKKENDQYDIALKEHLKVVDQKEIEKKQAIAAKIQQEKEARDIQLKRLEHRRRKETREEAD